MPGAVQVASGALQLASMRRSSCSGLRTCVRQPRPKSQSGARAMRSSRGVLAPLFTGIGGRTSWERKAEAGRSGGPKEDELSLATIRETPRNEPAWVIKN